MLRSDARTNDETSHNVTSNLKFLDINMISLIQKEIDSYDMISLVFLLYEVPDTALQRLIIYQRVSKDLEDDSSNLLHDWVLHVQHRSNWRDEFIEALVTCQLYSIIRRMGLDLPTIKRKYQYTSDDNTLIHPMKKALYKLCENMKTENLYKLKKTLVTYNIDVTNHESCELILLDLLCRRFITIKQLSGGKQIKSDPGIENLAKIIDNFPDLISFAKDFRQLENRLSGNYNLSPLNSSTPSINVKDALKKENEKITLDEFSEVFEMFNNLNAMEDDPGMNLQSDMLMDKVMYKIINPEKVGLCLIINQEKFHPSKDSIEGKNNLKPLDDRMGTNRDRDMLNRVMTELKFEVVTFDNLDHKAMIETIKDVIKYRFVKEHSIFMLCILSHGTRGHVYAADSVKVNVEYIESLLDSPDALHLRGKPKMLILQACQVEDDEPYSSIVADSPRSSFKYYIKKSDIIIYWATAPNYEAYRWIQKGSIFIQTLCKIFQQQSKTHHVNDMFTAVNFQVKNICTQLEREQLPKVEHTLDKNLYLQIPEK